MESRSGQEPGTAEACWFLLPAHAFALVLGCWTLAYHLSLLTGSPAGWIWLPFALLMMAVAWAGRGGGRPAQAATGERGPLWATLGFGLATGFASMFIAYFNPDDVNYLHRALLQLDHLDRPFEIGQSFFNVGVLPPLTTAHALTSHELLVVFLADLSGIDPLWAYQKLGGALGHLLFAFVFVALYRQLGLRPWRAWGAMVLVFCFCLADLHVPGRSYGDMLLALYLGKVLLWGVGLPLVLLLALRYLASPTRIRLVWVTLAAIGAIGLSGSAIFMVPTLLGATGAAFVLAQRPSRDRVLRSATLQLASMYGLLIGLAGLLGLLPRPADVSLFEIFPSDWLANLALVTDHPVIVVRDAVLLSVAPLLALNADRARFVVGLSLILLLGFATPLTGPILIELLTPGSYWRMLYLLPVLLCAGLTVEAILQSARSAQSSGLLSLLAICLPMIVIYASLEARDLPFALPDDPTRGRVALGAPAEWRLPPAHLQFADEYLASLRGRNILASKAIFPTLALLDPTLRFEAGRWTAHSFANAGDAAEGLRRERSAAVVSRCRTDGPRRAALLRSLRQGVDALVLGPCFLSPKGGARVRAILREANVRWSPPLRSAGFSLLLRQREAPPRG